MDPVISLATQAATSSAIEWGVSSRPFPGQTESGDLHIVAPFPGGVLVGAIDGLGHGPEAALAARCAAAVLAAAPDRPVSQLIEASHAALRGTRGAVMTIASIDLAAGLLTWIGVGNVDAVVRRFGGGRTRGHIIARGGVVGYQLPPLREAVLPVFQGDLLVFATDGVRHDFAAGLAADGPVQAQAAALIGAYAKTTDDALVLCVRYLGASS